MRWQSWLVLAAVVPWCGIAALGYALRSPAGATQTALGISLVLALLVFLARAATAPAAVTGGVITAVLTLGEYPWFHSALTSLAGTVCAHVCGDEIWSRQEAAVGRGGRQAGA